MTYLAVIGAAFVVVVAILVALHVTRVVPWSMTVTRDSEKRK